MQRITTPPEPDPIERLIDGAMLEASALHWGAPSSGGTHDAAAPIPHLPPGPDPIPGYQVLKQIRAGGQAVVYLGVQEATGRHVAIKMFRPASAPTSKDRYRFEREVEALQDLCHPGIVRILHADAGGPSPSIVMEYIPGWDLDEYFREHDLDVRATMRMFRTIVLAVHAAHQKGVIHRDIKPSNIRVDHNAEPHVFDFGLAKLSTSGAPDATMTQTGQFLGTLYWVSPEQAGGRLQDVDVRTDVYSLGVVLYHMLTGALPFAQGGSMRDVFNRIATAEPIPPRTMRQEIDDDAETIVLKCLAKEPGRRYASASELAEDVERWLEGRPILAKRDSLTYIARKIFKRHWLPCSLGAGILALALALAIGFGWYQTRLRRTTQADLAAINELLRAVEHLSHMPFDPRVERDQIMGLIRVADQLPRGCDESEFRIRQWVACRAAQCGLNDVAYAQGAATNSLAGRLYGASSEEHALALIAQARYALDARHPEEALDNSRGAIAASRHLDPTRSDAAVYALSGHAMIAFKRGMAADAEDATRQGVAAARVCFDHDPGKLAGTLKYSAELFLDIAKLRHAQGMTPQPLLEDAGQLQREALACAREAFRDQPTLLAHFVHSYALLLRDTGRLAEAEPLAREAIELRKKIDPGTGDAVYLYVSVGDLGVLYTYQGRFEEAEDLLQKAVAGLTLSDTPIFRQMRAAMAERLAQLYGLWSLVTPESGLAEAAEYWWGVASEIEGNH